jgi:hemerythrin-like domain-containing protein
MRNARFQKASRRNFFGAVGAGALLVGCRSEKTSPPHLFSGLAPAKLPDVDVTATEDLMREHGILRRVLVVYRETAARIRAKSGSVPLVALNGAVLLMRRFGEDYHERELEEAHVFPAVKEAGGPAAAELDVLLAQHRRGREITDYLLDVTKSPMTAGLAEPLAQTLEAFARMYEEHTAREDTIIFPAWKKALSPKALREQGDLFEELERKSVGKDGFEEAVEKLAGIEGAIGLDPAHMLAPPPPK